MKIEIDDKATVIIDELGVGERVVIPRAANQTDGNLPSVAETIYARKVTGSNKLEGDEFAKGFDKGWERGYKFAVNRMQEGLLTWDQITK